MVTLGIESTSAPACPESPGTTWKYIMDGEDFFSFYQEASIDDASVIAWSRGETFLFQK